MTFKSYLLAIGLAAAAPLLPATEAETRLLRFPTTNGEHIVFSYAGQLYTVPAAGGTARRLTDGPGYAIFPRFSPTASRSPSPPNTTAIPRSIRCPQRAAPRAPHLLGHARPRRPRRPHGPEQHRHDWRNTKPEVVFRSRWRSFNPSSASSIHRRTRRRGAGPAAGAARRLRLLLPDDTKIAYNRIFREFRTWKNTGAAWPTTSGSST
jgi:tricorn protease